MPLTKDQLAILQHTLGADQYGHVRHERNYFGTNKNFHDGIICESLLALGYMTSQEGDQAIFPVETFYFATKSGKQAMQDESPKPPKKTKGQRRYEEWLRGASDFVSFGEWLKTRDELQADGPFDWH